MAGPYAGHNTFLLVGEETTFNTEATTITSSLGYVENANSALNNNTIEIRSLGDRQVEDNIPGNFDGTLSIDGHLNVGVILEMFFGQQTAVETTGDYTHTFLDTGGSPSTLPCDIKSYSIEENLSCNGTDIVLTHTGAKVNSVEITLETNNTLRFSSEVVTTNLTKSTSAGTRATVATKPLGGFQGTLSLADTGGAYTDVGLPSTFTVSLSNNMDANDVKSLGSRENQELTPKNLTNPVTFTQKFANSVEFEQFLGGVTAGTTITNTDLRISVNNGVALGSGRVEFYLELENGQLSTNNINKAFDGIVEADYEYLGGRIKACFFVDGVATYIA